MKKVFLLVLSALTLLAFAACSNTVADVSTSDGGEIEVTESDIGTVEETVNPDDGPAETATAEYEAYTITYTDPEGYTTTEDGGGAVTYSLDGYDVGKIIYVPTAVEQQILDDYYAAVEAGEEQLQEYMAEYAANLDVDYSVETLDINGQQATLATGTVAEGSPEGNPGDVGYVLVMPVNDQMIVINGFADAETAETIRADMTTFAQSISTQPADAATSMAGTGSSMAASSSMAAA